MRLARGPRKGFPAGPRGRPADREGGQAGGGPPARRPRCPGGAERTPLVPGAPLVVVDIGSVHRLEEAAGGEDHVVAQRRAHQSLVIVARVVKEKVEAMIDEIRAHGTAEAVLVGGTVDADDGDVLPPRLVVRVRVLPREY